MKKVNFLKMQGLGNDFIVLNGFSGALPESLPHLAKKICHRQFGVGADGLLLVLPSNKADLAMRIYNADGSEPEMCGNGIRCVAKFAFSQGLVKKTKITVETRAGIMYPEIITQNGVVSGVRVDMGEPRLEPASIPGNFSGERVVFQPLDVEGEKYYVTAVSMGNPHCILFVDDVSVSPVRVLGPKIENHPAFPARTNVEFIEVIGYEEIKMRVWERGVGETLACGTGACAAAAACVLNSKTGRKITVHLLGGDLFLEWSQNNHIFMTGPAEEVFEGKYFNIN